MTPFGRSVSALLSLAVFTSHPLWSASSPESAVSTADCCDPTGNVTWQLNSLKSIGGIVPTVLGQPQLRALGNAAAIFFDGAHDGVVLPVSPIAGLAQFTIEVEINPSPTGNPEQRFFHIQDSANNRLLMEIRLANGQWALDTFLLHDKNSLPLLDRTKLHPSGSWHWVALRYDGHAMTSFVDGKQELAGEVAIAPMEPQGQTSIGVRLNRVFWFQGGIREVRIHPSALSPSELAH